MKISQEQRKFIGRSRQILKKKKILSIKKKKFSSHSKYSNTCRTTLVIAQECYHSLILAIQLYIHCRSQRRGIMLSISIFGQKLLNMYKGSFNDRPIHTRINAEQIDHTSTGKCSPICYIKPLLLYNIKFCL